MNKLFPIAQASTKLDDVFESLSAQSNVRLDDAFELLSAQASFASAEDLAMRNIIKA